MQRSVGCTSDARGGGGGEAEIGSIRHGTAPTALRESLPLTSRQVEEAFFFFRFFKMADDPKRVTLRRRIISLYQSGLSLHAVARQMGISPVTVKNG